MELMGKRQWSDSEWACVPGDVIDSILDKLFVISDYVRFSAVCKSWNSWCKKHYKETRILQSNHQLPWLPLYTLRRANPSEEKLNMYNITTGEISNFQFCVPNDVIKHDCTCYGSSYGWLFYMFEYSLLVFNPLSGTMIRLPQFDQRPFEPNEGGGRYVLSRDPSLGPFEVLAASHSYEAVAHLNSCDDSWTYSAYSEAKNTFDFYKLIFYKGYKLGVHDFGLIMFLDVISGECINVKEIASSPPRMNSVNPLEPYFVENTSGDLLLVHRYYYDAGISLKLDTYKIYKLMIQEGHEVDYIPIVNLGGDSLFLGPIHCVSVLATNYPGCLPNSIYCADHDGGTEESIEVFNLNNDIGSVSLTYIPDGYLKIALPTWLVMLPKF